MGDLTLHRRFPCRKGYLGSSTEAIDGTHLSTVDNLRATWGPLPSLVAMSTFAVDAQALAGLAEVLGTLGDELAGLADGDLTADFPRGDVSGATESLMVGWRRERLALADSLHDLRVGVEEASRQYAAAETEVASALPSGGPRP